MKRKRKRKKEIERKQRKTEEQIKRKREREKTGRKNKEMVHRRTELTLFCGFCSVECSLLSHLLHTLWSCGLTRTTAFDKAPHSSFQNMSSNVLYQYLFLCLLGCFSRGLYDEVILGFTLKGLELSYLQTSINTRQFFDILDLLDQKPYIVCLVTGSTMKTKCSKNEDLCSAPIYYITIYKYNKQFFVFISHLTVVLQLSNLLTFIRILIIIFS